MVPRMRTLDFWFDYTCPYAYLGSTQVERLALAMGANLTWKPMLLGGVFQANGTSQKLFAELIPQKARHNGLDMQRWAKLFGAELQMPGGHPFRSVEALRATVAAGCDPKVIHAFFRAYWVEGRPPSDDATLRDVLGRAGHDASALLARISGDDAKRDLRARTDEAIALGIFGAPAYVVDGKDLYWGQDRIHFVAGVPMNDLLPAPARAEGHAKHGLEIYWDFSSPFAYLASTQAEALAARTGATLTWRPMLIGGLFKEVGQPMVPMQTWSAAKQAYVFEDMKRWAAHWGVPFAFPSRFPMSSLKALRCYLALPEAARGAFRAKTFRAYWAEDRDIADDAVLRELVGPGADEILAKSQTPDVKQALATATKRAVLAGVFGAPTWVIDEEDLYWGQDRIPLVERALLA